MVLFQTVLRVGMDSIGMGMRQGWQVTGIRLEVWSIQGKAAGLREVSGEMESNTQLNLAGICVGRGGGGGHAHLSHKHTYTPLIVPMPASLLHTYLSTGHGR